MIEGLNLKDVFPDIYSKTAIAVLEEYPTPTAIIKADKDKLISIIQGNSHKSLKWATAKYDLLLCKAKEFEPLSINNAANITMLEVYISMVKSLQENLDNILKAINQVIIDDAEKDMPILSMTLELLQSIPGIGLITAATIIAEVGDFSTFTKEYDKVRE
jgi:transposase